MLSLTKKQAGLTLWSLSFLLLILAFSVLSVLRIMPFYTEYAAIVRSVNQVKTSGASDSITGLKNQLLEKFYHNDVRQIDASNIDQFITIKANTAGKVLTLNYTRMAAVPLLELAFDNLYYAVVFNQTYMLN